jgi:hypothetical protein
MTMRPCLFWRRFAAPVWMILASLRRKERHGCWLSLFSRQRQQYWWRGFAIQRRRDGPCADLADLEAQGVMAATHSLSDREARICTVAPNTSFAATAPPSGW